MNRVLAIDTERKTCTVEAGALVADVLDALRPHGLTLQNLASIKLQTIGGWISVGCHGTGAHLPPVEEQVVSLKVVAPGLGCDQSLTLSSDVSSSEYPKLFDFVKLGLGALGVITEVTLACVDAHRLREVTYVCTRREVREGHAERLRSHRHVRYMWLPYTDACVVVVSDPITPKQEKEECSEIVPGKFHERSAEAEEEDDYILAPLRELFLSTTQGKKEEEAEGMGFAELRDALLEIDPLNVEHVRKVNCAEAEFWRRSEGTIVDDSDEVLGFECGGQQWVCEVALPAGSLERPSLRDVDFVLDALAIIERDGIAAPAPIEQRWSCGSRAPMSPVSRHDDGHRSYVGAGDDTLHSWVGIIMYLPTKDAAARAEITSAFEEYKNALRSELWEKYHAHEHWAKIEEPLEGHACAAAAARIRARYPVDDFNAARRVLDPKNILSNSLINKLFGDHSSEWVQEVDAASRHTYYFNTKTGHSQWEDPAGRGDR